MSTASLPPPLELLGLRIGAEGDPGPFAVEVIAHHLADGLAEIELRLQAATTAPPPDLVLRLSMDGAGISHIWRPDACGSKGICGGGRTLTARAATQAPILCLHGIDGVSRLCLANADATHGSALSCHIREEDCRLYATLKPFLAGRAPGTAFTARLRLDRRAQPWHAAVQAVSAWWEAMPGHAPLPVPAAGLEAMYSTWYSFHQAVDPQPVLEECRLARALGCTAVILDDGWQTRDTARGYAFAGDWQPERMGDMAAFVRQVHDLGLHLLLWYAVPLIGYRTDAFARFEHCLLRRDDGLGCGILDPRYPEVRSFLADLYERQLIAWDLDGVKLDFIDTMQPSAEMPLGPGDGRDIGDLDEAVDALMKGIAARLRAVRPDVLIEFRQSYTGPMMRTYGNLFRAGDCPYDAAANRERTVTIRMLCGTTATHADMLMWSPSDRPEVAARQLLAVLFAVPQVSVLIGRLDPGQRAMLAFWLEWWRQHRDTLLHGKLTAEEPEAHYPLVVASTATETVMAAYADRPLRPTGGLPACLWLVNATARDELLLVLDTDAGERQVLVRDCQGTVIADNRRRLGAGAHRLAVPPSGVVQIA